MNDLNFVKKWRDTMLVNLMSKEFKLSGTKDALVGIDYNAMSVEMFKDSS